MLVGRKKYVIVIIAVNPTPVVVKLTTAYTIQAMVGIGQLLSLAVSVALMMIVLGMIQIHIQKWFVIVLRLDVLNMKTITTSV